MTDIWGIDVEGRRMVFEPWPVDPDGQYRNPSDAEREETYALSGEAVRETLEYFQMCGGDSSRLVAMLNAHVTNALYSVNVNTLLDDSRWYTGEYYFYFIMFTKKVIGRYDFHYGEGTDRQLSIHHRIYEKGFLDFLPFGEGIKDTTNTIPTTVLKCYLPNHPRIVDFIEWADVLTHEKGCSYKDDISGHDNVWVDIELMAYLYEFFLLLTNMGNMRTLLDPVVCEFKYLNMSFIPKQLFPTVLIKVVNSTTNVISVSIKSEKKGILLSSEWKRKTDIVKFSHYQKAVLTCNNCVVLKGALQVFRNASDLSSLPQYELLSDLSADPFSFYLRFSRGNDTWYAGLFLIINIVAIVIGYVIKLRQLTTVMLFVALMITINAVLFFSRAFIREKEQNRINKKHSQKYISDKEKYIIELQSLSTDLLAAKTNLEAKVEERTRELALANEKLKELDRAKTDFYCNVSHELRTPLTLIKSPIEAIMQGRYGQKIPSDHQIFAIMTRNANRLLRQVNNLLDFAKIDQGQYDLRIETLDCATLVGFYVAELESAAAIKGIAISFEREASEAWTRIDRTYFETAFFNVATNALKFTPNGGSVIVRVARDDGNVVISIRDTGIGIPADRIETIFDRFTQIDHGPTRSYEGTGIGLSLVREIMGILGGTIAVSSDEGKGSVFSLLLPESSAPETKIAFETVNVKPYLIADLPVEANPHIGEGDSKKRTETILLVEDNADLANYVMPFIEDKYRLETASNGREALSLLEDPRHTVDLVVTDVMMPVMDGRELYRRVSSSVGLSSIPFLFVTARALDSERIQTLREGAVDYLYKPFSIEELLAKIDSLILLARRYRESTGMEIEKRILNAIRNDITQPRVDYFEAHSLSSREREVAALILEGKRNKEIAIMLELSEHTVAHHIESIYKKTDTGNRLEFINRMKNPE